MNIKDNTPQALLMRGKESLAKYHVIGNDEMINSSMLKSILNKISIAQLKRSK